MSLEIVFKKFRPKISYKNRSNLMETSIMASNVTWWWTQQTIIEH